MNRTLATILLIMALPAGLHAQSSTCYGTSKQGRLENAVALPEQGSNYFAYHAEPVRAGRTFLHSQVAEIVSEAYAQLVTTLPDTRFMYGETGLQHGGPFPPHKTHQNGTSVDFFVPVLNTQKQSVLLPISKSNRYGYDIEFDKRGRYQIFQIDFDALGAHLLALQQAAKKHGSRITRVILDPQYHALLYKSQFGTEVKKSIVLQKEKSWVRHDEHYHVDFSITCKPLTAR